MKTTLALALAVSLLSIASRSSAQPYSIDWHSIDNGGGTSVGGDFSVRGSIAQLDISKMSGGDYAIAGGFSAFLEAAGITTIFDNIGGSDNGGFGATSNTWIAGKFCLGAQSYQLDSLTLLLSNGRFDGQPAGPSAVRLRIYANDPVSGKPSRTPA